MVSKHIREIKKSKYFQSLHDVELVKSVLKESKGGDFADPTRYEDMYMHVDLWWFYNGMKLGVDVKGVRCDVNDKRKVDNSIQWVELRSVNNRPGSLFGEQIYFIYVTNTSIIIVRRDELEQFIKKALNDDELFNLCKSQEPLPFDNNEWLIKHDIKDDSKRYYKPHNRKGSNRSDIVMKITVNDLRKIMSDEIIFG